VVTAARIIKKNMTEGRVPIESAILLTSAIYRDPAGSDPLLAREKALFLRDMALVAIRRDLPGLAEVLTPFAGIVDMNTRQMKVVE